VGKGSAESSAGKEHGSSSPRLTPSAARCRRRWTASGNDPRRGVCPSPDFVITATGNRDIVTVDQMQQMKDLAVLGNDWPLRQRDRHGGSIKSQGCHAARRSSPRSTSGRSRSGRSIIVLSRGACSISETRPVTQFRDEQLLHQPDHGSNRTVREQRYVREEGLRLATSTSMRRLPTPPRRVGVKLTTLTKNRLTTSASRLKDPTKPDTYRY